MDGKDLDKLFNDKLANYSAEPSTEVMGSMNQYFGEKSRKKVLNYIFIAASISTLVFLIGWSQYLQIQNIENEFMALGIKDEILEADAGRGESNLNQQINKPPNQQMPKQSFEHLPNSRVRELGARNPVSESANQQINKSTNQQINKSTNQQMIEEEVVPFTDEDNLMDIEDSDQASPSLADSEQAIVAEKLKTMETIEESFKVTIIYKPGKRSQKPDSTALTTSKEKKKASLMEVSEFARNVKEKSPTLGDIRSAKDELLAFNFLKKNKDKIQNNEDDE